MSVPNQVVDLVERFEADRETFRSTAYKEEWIRLDFIDPLFEVLGWDVTNKSGVPVGPLREVIPEDAIRVRGATKAPDYGFYVGGARKFFIEAKKPSVNLEGDVSPAFQLRRYAWSAKLSLSILTDFEEFALYDCRFEPKKEDSPRTARLNFLTYEQYPERWDEIASIFSKEAILSGSLEKYAEETKRRRGTETVDSAFLREIEGWRSALARDLATRNDLNRRHLNYAVQMTIDRIVFLRMAEDRGIEDYGKLLGIVDGNDVYGRLVGLFKEADDRYNSGLFHFRLERNREEDPDTLTPTLEVGDRLLRRIIRSLYYPDSPYEFSVLPVDVLGQVYEQFLGKVIRLTNGGHNAVVEEKPEVRRAGGVYYTPTYIVDYIVEHTVGKLLEGKRPGPRGGASKLKIVDPACGSGSFLIGAYQYLLDWHRDRYLEDGPEKWPRQLYQGPGEEWRLTIEEKKRILTKNIYGVDIDPQAVEVTKLSLVLKVLEGETDETLESQLRLFAERALPDLDNNIKCGNSLISPAFYEDPQMSLLSEEEHYRINVFSWEKSFPEAFSGDNPGFDAVIGNPPYVFGRDWKALGISNEVKTYLGKSYKSSPYQLDMFSIFMEKAFILCRLRGWIGQIVPNVWLTNTYSSTTRRFIFSQSHGLSITVPPTDVFGGLTVDTVVYTLQKSQDAGDEFRMLKMDNGHVQTLGTYKTEKHLDGQRPISTAADSTSMALVECLKENWPELGDIAKLTRGVHPYRVGGYGESAFGSGFQTERDVKERPYHSKERRPGYRAFIYGRDLRRLAKPRTTEYVRYGPWLAEPRQPEFFEGERVYSRKILGQRLIVTVGTTNSIADQQVYITRPTSGSISAAYLAGILGSSLMAFFIRSHYDEVTQAFPQIKVGQLKRLPIRTIDFTNQVEVLWHDRMVELVERMLTLHEKLAEARIERERTIVQHRIQATDRLIDRLVYELYGLTDKEIETADAASQST